MPEAAEILDGLRRIANDAVWLAVAWHVVLVVALAFAKGGWRPPKRWAALMLAMPIVSAALLAWLYGNPFNATVLGAVSVALIALGPRLGAEPVEAGPRWAWWLGLAVVLYGAFYPHFLETDTLRVYLVAAPTGLVPCPSLSVVIGLGLMAGGLGSRTWCLLLAVAGLFYGLFGMLRLGVYLDAGLVIGALGLGARGLVLHMRRHPPAAGPTPGGAERAA